MALSLDPYEMLSRDAIVKPYRTIIDPAQGQEEEYAIIETIRKTLLDKFKGSRYLSMDSGSSAIILQCDWSLFG